jgi:hypothetical protein
MRVVEFQNSRLNLLAEKVREEEKLAGDFLRIFPRPESRAIYNPICEDSGSEHWDLKLGNLLFDSTMEITQRDYEQYHSEIIDAENVSFMRLYFNNYPNLVPILRITKREHKEDFGQRTLDRRPLPGAIL